MGVWVGAQHPFMQVLTATTIDPYLCTRGDDKSEVERLQQKVHDYVYMRPYCSMEEMDECTPLVFGNNEK